MQNEHMTPKLFMKSLKSTAPMRKYTHINSVYLMELLEIMISLIMAWK